MSELLARIAAKAAGTSNSDASQPSPVVMMLLKQFGLTPEKIEEMIAPIISGVKNELALIHNQLTLVVEGQDLIKSRLCTLENKLTEIECNMRVLLKDTEHDDFLEQLKANCVVTQPQNIDTVTT